jgi:hypothetical protein
MKVDKSQKQSETKLDGSLKYYCASCITSKHEDFNLVFTNHGMEDGIYPLKRDRKAHDKDQRSIVQHAKTPTKGLRFQLIENIAVL